MTYSIKGYSGALATLITAGISVASIKAFLSGTFTRAFVDYNLVDVLLAITMIMFIFAIILLLKDIIDGGGWTYKEKQRALKGFGIGIILIIGAFYGASFTTSTVLVDPTIYMFHGTGYYAGGTAESILQTFVEPKYVVLAAGTNNDNTYLEFKFNQTGFSFAFLRELRGFNLTVDDDGITAVNFQFIDYNGGSPAATDLLTSGDSEIDIVDLGSTSSINATFTLTTVLIWLAAHTYNEVGDRFQLKVTFASDYAENAIRTYTIQFLQSTDTDVVYYLVMFVMSIGFGYPCIALLDLTNAVRAPKKRYSRRKKSSRRRNYGRS